MRKAWLNEMVAVKRSSLDADELASIEADLTIQQSSYTGSESVELFAQQKGWLWLPRIYGYRKLSNLGYSFKDQRTKTPTLDFKVDWKILDQPPYPHDQSILVKTAVEKTRKNGFGGFVVAPTGSGKTLLMSYVGALLKGPMLIAVLNTGLLKNWRKAIKEHIRLGGKAPRIGVVQGSQCEFGPRYPFVVSTVQSLAQKDYPEELYSSFRTLVVDEAHHQPCMSVMTAFHKFSAKYFLGCTATLRRKDGLEKVFQHAFGDVLYTMHRGKVPGRVFFVQVPFLIQPSQIRSYGKLNLGKVGTVLGNLEYRNLSIIEHAIKAFKVGRKLLILAATREHLANLYALFPKVIQRRVGFYVGGRKEHELDEAAAKKILLGTFKMAEEGMDVPALDTLVLASPLKDCEQATGRIMREHADKMSLVVIDFVDKYKTFVNWARDRASFYKKEGFTIKTDLPIG